MRAKEGRPTGGRAFGYDRVGDVIEAEAAVVREIFERTAAGESTAVRSLTGDIPVFEKGGKL
jgi:hypothetical protein